MRPANQQRLIDELQKSVGDYGALFSSLSCFDFMKEIDKIINTFVPEGL
jgi:hypothetical protein